MGSFARHLFALAVMAALAIAMPADAAGAGKKKVTVSESFVALPSLTASVAQDFEVRGMLHVEAGIEVKDAKQRALAEAILPRLRAACAEALRDYAGDQFAYGDVPDADRIAVLLQAAIDRELGGQGADLILGMVIIHEAR